MQLVAYGAQDVYLTGNPQMTFFKTVYRRYTNFSMECVKQSFKGTPAAGQRVIATLARSGDLVHDCFIKVPSYKEAATHADDNPGHNMIDYIELEIGGQCIDKHFGHWMEAHAELTEGGHTGIGNQTDDMAIRGDRAPGNTQGTDGFRSVAYAGGIDGKGNNHIPDFYVPLRFWFNRHVGLSLPLIALQYHEVNIIVKFSEGGFFYRNTDTAVADVPSLWCNYIYLDTDERRRFAQVSHEYLIEQVQMQSFTASKAGQTLKLNFNHPVKELVWVNIVTTWGTRDGDSGSFGELATDNSGANTWQLKLNGHDRFEKQSTTYFTRYQPWKYHTSVPNGTATTDNLAVYSFALKPEEHQPSGTCNFSRIDNAQLNYSVLPVDGTLYVYAVNYNVLRIMSGMGGLAYSD